MLELVLVRHGETDSNVRGTYCGWTDVRLNQRGISQARSAARRLKGMSFEAVYSSPLLRAYRTARIITSGEAGIICSDSLKEHNFGIWEDLTYGEIRRLYPQEADKWEGDWMNYQVAGGESAVQGYRRITGFVDELLQRHREGSVLAVTHLGCIRYMLVYLLGMSMEDIWRFSIDNGGITRVMINDEKYAYLKAMNI